ncbi:MAG: hypothetical protein G01um101417_497 [Parcubacteria group bacterium Gr01-1014_17]|nr:MAG: hypothetical protein G01um101417_497 [Parcubacteria group bacterium Gr01-1014_17]
MKTHDSYFPSDRPEGNSDGSDDFNDSDESDIENKIVCEETENP